MASPAPYPPPIPVSDRCAPRCPGWLHMNNDPDDLQRCDDCARFENDDQAALAHEDECHRPNCQWKKGATA